MKLGTWSSEVVIIIIINIIIITWSREGSGSCGSVSRDKLLISLVSLVAEDSASRLVWRDRYRNLETRFLSCNAELDPSFRTTAFSV